MKESIRGFALVLVLLALIALTGIATFAFRAGLGQVRAAALGGDVLRNRVAAESAVAWGLAQSGTAPPVWPSSGDVLLGQGILSGESRWELRGRSLSDEYVLLLGRGDREGLRGHHTVARVVWWLRASARVRSFAAAVESAGILGVETAVVDTLDVLGGRSGVASCLSEATLAGVPPQLPLFAPLPGSPEWGGEPGLPEFAELRMGWLPPPTLQRRAQAHPTGRYTSSCPTCWAGLVYGDGDLVLGGGGMGVLVVAGDLFLDPMASWTGLLLVQGRVVIGPGAVVTGLIRSGAAVELGVGSVFSGSLCAAFRALESTPELQRPVPIPFRSWVGPL